MHANLPFGSHEAADQAAQHTALPTVLLVEDEEAVRRLARMVLELTGYAVLEAADAAGALAACGRHAGPVQLVVMDVVLPGLSGPDLAARLRESRPGLQVLYTSGYAQEDLAARGVSAGAAVLTKPFLPFDLVRAVRRAMAGPGGGPDDPAAAYCDLR